MSLFLFRHITELAKFPERVDPHLGNNQVLVSHLCRIEETWHVAQKYLQDSKRLHDLLGLIEFIYSIVQTEKAIYLRSSLSRETGPAFSPRAAGCEEPPRSIKALKSNCPLSSPSGKIKREQLDGRQTTSTSTESEAAETLEDRVINCDVGAFLAVSYTFKRSSGSCTLTIYIRARRHIVAKHTS